MAILYALFIFIIAEVASIVSEIGYRNKKYRQTMREVNLMMREHKFPGDLRYRLRKYIRFRHVQQDGNSAGVSLNASPERRYILSLLSPQLRQEAMVHMNNVGIGQVKLFQDSELPNDALLALSVGAHIEVYAGHEFIYKAGDAAVSLNVVVKGVVSNKGRLVRRRDTLRGSMPKRPLRVHRQRIHDHILFDMPSQRRSYKTDVQKVPAVRNKDAQTTSAQVCAGRAPRLCPLRERRKQGKA